MKKLIAIAVVFALVAVGAAFAETSVGGNLKIGGDLIGGSSIEDSDPYAGKLVLWDSHANVNFSGEKAGGMLRVHAHGQGSASPLDWTPDVFTFGWWKPVEQLRIQLGVNPDGDWGAAQISGWGFNAEAQGGTALDQYRKLGANGSDIARTTKGWYGGFNGLGAAVSIFPTQGLTINWALPLGSQTTLAETYGRSHFNAAYNIQDIGTIRVALKLNGEYEKDKANSPDFWGSFYLIAVENIGVDLGLGFVTPAGKDQDGVLGVGLGFRYGLDDFSIKLRAGVDLNKEGDDSAPVLGVHILPAYNVGPCTILLNAGLGVVTHAGDVDADIGWFINPYVKANMGGGTFYGGIQLYSIGKDPSDPKGEKDLINWAVPITYNFYF
jgi:hypothetical protein